MKPRLAARKACRRDVERPEERRVTQRAIHARCIDTRRVQNSNRIERWRIRQRTLSIRSLKEILVALDHAAEREAIERLRNEKLRFHFRVDGLGVDLIERQAEEKRTQVVVIGDRAESVEVAFGRQACFLTAFLQRRRADAAVVDSKEVQIYVRGVAGPHAEFPALRPSAQRKIFCSHKGVHAAVDRPVERVADDIALGGGTPDGRYQKACASHLPSYGMGSIGKVENRETVQHELAVVNAGIATHIYHHFVRLKLPVRARQFARGDGPVVDEIVVWTRLLHKLSGESERSARGQYGTLAAEPQSGSGGNVVETTRLSCQVIVSMTGSEVVVIRAPVQTEVS